MSSLKALREIVVEVDIPPQFETYVVTTLLRIRAQYPSYIFAEDSGVVTIRGPVGIDEDVFRKSILHAIYREKIYAETLSMRQALVSAVTGK